MRCGLPLIWIGPLLAAFLPSAHGEESGRTPQSSIETGFVSIFDGKTFQGWETPDRSYWSIVDGALTGTITREHPCSVNQYLVWTGKEDSPQGELADFELRLRSRVNGRGGINNGFQFRSRLLPDHDMAGYQVDNNLGTDWLVRLYDEFGRHTLAFRGERTIFDGQGKKTTTKLEGPPTKAHFRLEEWHDYHLVCVGEKLTLKVNDLLVAEVIDRDPRRQDLQGKLGLQLHSGPETVVQFKDIRLKILKPVQAPLVIPQTRQDRDREKLFSTTLARWDLGAGGHGGKFPLRQAADFYGIEFDVRATGTNARPGSRVCLFHGGCFAGPKDFPTDMPDWTYYVRFYLQPGTTRGTLLAKGPSHESPLTISTQLNPRPPLRRGARRAQPMEVLVQKRTAPAAGPSPAVRLDDDFGEEWVDLIIVHSGKRELYLLRPSGSEKSTLTGEATPLLRNQHPLTIGGILAEKPQDLFEGEIEEIAVWSRGLTEEEISTLSPEEDRPPPPAPRRPRFRRRPGPLALN